jgi:carboxyl-terminal processing protease
VRGRLEDDAVVLRISTFNEQTFQNLEEEIAKQIEEAGGIDAVAGFVIDLRNNPGGLLNQAISVTDAFLESGEIVSTRGRDARDSDRYNATEGDLAQGKPIVVVINGGSASASEIVAGALQDHRRAVVVGTQSFGKGSVQTIMPVQGDGAMRLTTARYYTPSGRSIQALGVAPDIIVEERLVEAPAEDENGPPPITRSEAELRGSLENDSLTEDERNTLEADRLRKEETARLRAEDYQMSYALDILRGLAFLNGSN